MPPRSAAAELVRFAAVGVTNTLLSAAVYLVLVRAHAAPPAAGALASAAGALNGFLLNRRWTFRRPGSALRYTTVQAAGAAATSGLLWLIGGVAAYFAVLPLVTLATFAANRSWTFRAGAQPARSRFPA